jgi:seryl-tRNA synthetase
MLDIKWIVNNPEKFKKEMEKRGHEVNVDHLIELYNIEKQIKETIEEYNCIINECSKSVGKLKKQGKDSECDLLVDIVKWAKNEIKLINKAHDSLDEERTNSIRNSLINK